MTSSLLSARRGCDNWGKGPIGSLWDYCGEGARGDVAEGITLSLLSLLVIAAMVVGPRDVNTLAGSVLVATSTFHVLYGEGDMLVVRDMARESWERAAVLALVNTREITVLAVTNIIAWIVVRYGTTTLLIGIAISGYCVAAGVCVWLATSTWSQAGDALLVFDITGVLLGIAIMLTTRGGGSRQTGTSIQLLS